MTILDAKYTSMVIRSIPVAVIAFFIFISAYGQSTDPALIATAGMLGGTYACKSSCLECESTVAKLKLTSDGKTSGGTYLYTKSNYYGDGTKKLVYRSTGNWHLLKNKVAGDNTTIAVVDINYGDEPETYPLFMLRKDGNLLELNQQFIERYPQYLYKDSITNSLYIARENGKPLLLAKAQHYKDIEKGFADPTADHVYKKQ